MKILQKHKTIKEQINILKENGLQVDSDTESHLEKYGFVTLAYRFGPLFQEKNGKFIEGTKFSDLYSLFLYEKQLGAVLREGLSVFEHALKASIANILSIKYGIFAHSNIEIFDKQRMKNEAVRFLRLKISLANTEMKARTEFKDTVLETENITIHMLIDSLMLFNLSEFYSFLTKDVKTKILASITENYKDTSKFTKKMHQLRILRNLIDHNSSIHGEIYVSKIKSSTSYGRAASILSDLNATKETLIKVMDTVETDGEHNKIREEWLEAFFDVKYKPRKQEEIEEIIAEDSESDITLTTLIPVSASMTETSGVEIEASKGEEHE